MTKIYERLVILWKNIKRSRSIKVLLIVIIINLILGGIYSLITGAPFYEAIYYTSDYLTNTGTGLVGPTNRFTWWLTSAVIWLGLGITLVFVENVYLRLLKREETTVKFHNHVLLLGYGSKMRYLINNLEGEIGVHHDYVLINDDEERPYDLPDIIEYISGDPKEERTIRKANGESADQAVVVMGDDADSLMVCSTFQHLNPDAWITVNIRYAENIKHFKRLDIEEIVCDEELSGKALIEGFNKGKERNK